MKEFPSNLFGGLYPLVGLVAATATVATLLQARRTGCFSRLAPRDEAVRKQERVDRVVVVRDDVHRPQLSGPRILHGVVQQAEKHLVTIHRSDVVRDDQPEDAPPATFVRIDPQQTEHQQRKGLKAQRERTLVSKPPVVVLHVGHQLAVEHVAAVALRVVPKPLQLQLDVCRIAGVRQRQWVLETAPDQIFERQMHHRIGVFVRRLDVLNEHHARRKCHY